MTRKQQRIYAIVLVLVGASVAVLLTLSALKETVTYFYSPTDIIEELVSVPEDRAFRMGGMVKKGSIENDGKTVHFILTDLAHEMAVQYEGIPPNLFQEGQGVIATGTLQSTEQFIAEELLAKHDENYMPPEVAETLEKSLNNSNTTTSRP